CSQIVTWTEPTYTDDCPVTVTSTHQSGDRFDIGDTEVTYTFTDSSGNVSTCTFTVTVVGQSIELTPAGTYVDGSGAVLSTLNIGQQFYYRLQYRNTGQEHIREAKLTVILPEGLLVTSDGTADVTGASVGTSIPTYTYSATTKTFEFDIPDQTLLAGTSNQRTILIPLALVGDCDDFGKPCANYLRTDFAFAYTGGNVQCVIPPRTANGTTAITVSTDSCQRSELYCAGDELLITAESGFDTYRWYRNGTLLNGVTGASYTATTEGLYRVEKVTNCDGVQVISTETVNYYGVATLPNPLRDIEDGGATCADDGTWTSHFILCNEPSRVLSVNFRNTTNLQWQRLNADCAIGGFNCPNYADACYTTITNGTDFTADTEGNYRLVVTGDDGCRAVYYFNVYKNGIDGEVSKSDYTEYQAGYINVQMETSGLTYTYILKDANGNIVQGPVTKTNATTPTVIDGWKHTFENLQEGTYTVEVSSPSLPASCIYTEQVIINKTTELEMTANLLAWTGCNEVRIRFTAQGGRVPYKFAVWSIDGVALYPNFVSIPESAFEATIPAGQSSVEGLFKITQPGRYVFVVQDADQKSALLAETQALDIRPEGLYGFTYDITDVKCGSTPNTGAIRLTFAQQQNRTTVLYQVENGNRTQVGTNATGVYTGLYEGNYELEISITIGTEVCTYTQPFTVGGAENTLYAFAGVVQDKSCDTASPQRYQVAINNAGGGVAPYEYSFDGNTYGTSNVGYLGGSATVYVRDSEGCVLPLDVVIAPTEIPQISVSPVAYDCDGYGTFTITATATTPMEYRYQIDNGELLLSNVIGPLAPRATPYNLTVYYTPAAAAGMTPNILFTEDFGTGADTCGNNINYLACKTGEVLSNGDYTITAQLQANTGWVAPTPTDASGVANGRYLAVMGANTTGNAGILYYKDLKDIVSGRDMNVSLNLFNLLSATANGQNPHIVLELANAQGTVIATRDLGILTASQAWESKEVTFTGLTVTEAQFRIRNTSSGNALGNDIAIDDIRIWQDTEYCQTNVPQTVLVEPGKAFNAVLTGSSDISCPNGDDGTLTVHVSNPPASLSVEYSIDNQTTWTATTVNTDGEFTVGGLSVTAGGTLHVRSADDTSCVKSLPYTLSEPDTMSITTEQIKFISCATTDNLASVRVTATGGTRPYAQFRYREEGTTAWSTPQTAVNNETTFTNLNAGTYEVEIEDAGGCTATTTFEVAAKRDVVITTQFTYCYTGNRDAEITVQVQDGNGNYQFSKDGGLSWEDDDAVAIDGLGYHVFGNLTDGTYDIMVRDGLGCSTTTTVVITPQLQLNVIQTQDLDCRGNGASFSLTAIGGQGVKTFAWSIDGATYTSANTASETLTVTGNTAVFVTSAEGTYYFRVQDELRDDGFTRCEDVSNVYEVKAEQPRWVAGSEPTATHILCNGATTGQINVTANAIDTAYGLAPYTVEVYEDDGTGQASGTTDLGMYNLPAGDYVVIITDAKGCTSTPTQVSITQPDALQVALTVKPLQCNGNGSMTLGGVDIYLGDGGTAGFTVVLNNASGQQIATNTMGNTQTVTVSNLNFGRYTVVITDANNCVTTREFTVDAYSDIMITAVPTVSAIGCEPGTGAILVSAYNSSGNALGDGSFFFAVYQPGLVFNESDTTTWFPGATATITYTDSNGVPQQATGATYEFTTLTPGASYVFAVYDKTTECIYIQESTIPVPTTSTMSVTLSAINNETCFGANNGHAVFTLTGLAPNTTSVDYQVYTYPDGQPVGAVENTTSYTDIATPKALAPGEYYIVFTEQNASGNGCVNASERFIIRRSATLLEVTATSPKNDNCHPNAGQIVVQATGGTAPYQYIYRNDDTIPTDADWTATTAISTANVEGGVWTVFVRDAYNCVQSAVVTVTTDPSPVITSVVTENICANNGNYNIEVTMTTLGTGAHSYRLNGGIPVAINWLRSDVFLVSNLLPSAQLGISPQSIEVIDVNGCSHSMTFDIFEPLTYQASVTKELDCSATPSAELTIRNVQGGTGNYTYTVDRIVTTLEPVLDQDGNPVVDQDGNPVLEEVETVIPHVTATAITNPALTTATVMLEGTYRINVYDANTAACPVSVDVLLSAARVPVVTVDTVTNELCDSGTGAGTGSISVSAVNNGIGPFAFEITEIQDLGTGVATPTSEVFPTNGYNAVFNSLKGSESGIVYTIKVTSTVNSCATYVQAIVTSPAPMALAANALTATQYGCLSDGTTSLPTLTFDASLITGGSGTYVRYEFYDADTNTRLQQGLNTEYRITHPNGGRYYVTAYDSNGCEVSSPIVTVSPTLVLDDVTLSVVSGITCLQGEELMATVNTTPAYATFANAPQLTYILANADGTVEIERTSVNATTYTFVQLLQAGSYLVTVRNDDTGCEVRSTHTVLRPDTFELTATNATAVQCNGGTDGSIVLTFIDTYLADGDQALNGFDYQITNADTGAAVQNGTAPAGTTQVTITGLSAGTFHAVATSLANNCQTPLIAFSIRQSELPITVTAQETFGVTCTNDRGEILVTVSGGEAPYTVTLTPQGGTPITHTGVDFMTLFTGLGAGTGSLTYTVSVTDALGCSDVTATSITEVTLELPETVTATTVVTPISCPGAADGVIQLFGTAGGSGAGTYHYILNNITTGTSSPAQTVSYFDNLAPGEYSITITDAWNCDIELPSVTLVDPTAITFSVTTSDLVVCYGGTDTGSISFVVDGGSPQYEILLLNMTTNAQLNTATGIAPGTTVTFNNLVPGINYGITVTDTNGCTLSTTHTFALTEMPNVRATAAQSENCQTNAYQTWIEVRFPSAVDFSKITYVLNGTATATAQSFSRTEGLVGYIDTFDRTVASQYVTLFYTDTVNGQTETCDYTTPSFEVVNRSALALTRLPNDALNTIEVAASGGVSPYTYFFNGRDSGTDGVYRLRANDPQETDPVTGLKFKVIEVLAEDAAGCTVSMTIKAEYYDIEIPDYFTPDNDGNNDTWTPKYLDNYPYARTHIFDRYGRKLATLAVGETWNGRYNGNELPSGDYWFVLELNDINDKREFKGHFTLYR
ncbi:MAG: T9SS type B sorting domain-containing protein, partial [Capnocytophaga sp.]|nr:T9SS type B sorting domain-containing protein [Capnocytophaga sp.]